jgi:hypothetical protein
VASGRDLGAAPLENAFDLFALVFSPFVDLWIHPGTRGPKSVHLPAQLAPVDRKLDEQVDDVAGYPVKRQP